MKITDVVLAHVAEPCETCGAHLSFRRFPLNDEGTRGYQYLYCEWCGQDNIEPGLIFLDRLYKSERIIHNLSLL